MIVMLHSVSPLVCLSISTPHHTLSQRRTISFYYSLYYTRGTAVVASIQGVSRRKIFRETPAHSLAEHFAMCGRVSLRNLGAEFVLAVYIFCFPLMSSRCLTLIFKTEIKTIRHCLISMLTVIF